MSLDSAYDFSGKVVIITGGSRGLGHAMALAFARAGANLAIASRKIESCEETVKEVRALGSDGTAHAFNVGRWSDCDRLCEEVYTRWRRADVLINNAGMSPTRTLPAGNIGRSVRQGAEREPKGPIPAFCTIWFEDGGDRWWLHH